MPKVIACSLCGDAPLEAETCATYGGLYLCMDCAEFASDVFTWDGPSWDELTASIGVVVASASARGGAVG